MYPYERLVLLGLAVLRAELTLWVPVVLVGLFGIALWRVGTKRVVIVVIVFSLGSMIAVGTAFTSADVIEHNLKRAALGTAYNPFYEPCGEWEGYTGPCGKEPADFALWNASKCGPTPAAVRWWGDPGSGSYCK